MSGITNPAAAAPGAHKNENHQKQMKHKATKNLMNALKTGKYPPGTTAKYLAAKIVSDAGETALHGAAYYGTLPAGTTNADLMSVRDEKGNTPLHLAAVGGNLLPGTTVDDLIRCKNNRGWTALHEAAGWGNLPLNTTVQALESTCTDDGMTALIVAALHGNLPAGTTAQDLRNGKKFNGKSPLELLAKDQVMTVLNNLGAADGDEFAGSLEC